MREISKTLITYYQGAYGSTIRIDVKTIKWLEHLKNDLYKLINGDIQEIEFTCIDNVEIVDIESFLLVRVQREKRPKIAILNKNNKTSRFIWSQDIEELFTLIGLIDGLLSEDTSGHQYLTTEADNVLVILAYKE